MAAVLGPTILYLAFVERLLAAGLLLVYGLTAVAVVDDGFRTWVVDRESSHHAGVVLPSIFGGVCVFGVLDPFHGLIILDSFGTLLELLDEYHVTDV